MRDPWKRGGESSGEQRCGRKESRGDGTSECSTGVHVPTTYPAYLSLRCARDILISSTLYIYISLSFSLLPLPPPPLSPPPCVVSVYLLPSVYASIPFDPFFFLFIARSSLSLFIYALPRYVIPLLFAFIDDYLVRFLSFVLCIHARGTRTVCFAPLRPLFLLPFLWMDSAGPRGGGRCEIDVDTDTDTGHAQSVF